MILPLRIALFVYSTQPRGGVVHTLELAEALHKLGHQVSVYALAKDGKGFGQEVSVETHLIPAEPVNGDIDTLIRQRIQEFVDYLNDAHLPAHSYDCYHAQDCISANALASLRSRHQIPHFIRTVHHIEAFNSPYLQTCQDRSIREPDLCLCVSEYWQQQLQQDYRIDAKRVINGVNLDRFSSIPNATESQLKQTLELNGNPIYLTVGGIEPRKNSIALLQAFARVLQKFPPAQLVIAGGATLFDYQSYRTEFLEIADRLKIVIGQALILPGVLSNSELSTLYHTADAFVFPSITEGWGMVILEAIAAGLPVITSDRSPFTEFLTPQQALLVDPRSIEDIAQAMIDITQPDLAHSLIHNSRSICTDYSWETSAKMHLNYYRSAIV